MNSRWRLYFLVLIATLFITSAARGQNAAEITIQADQVTAHISPLFYGLMTEEINYSYDGGIYAELIRNRNFKEDLKDPVHWQALKEGSSAASIALDPNTPFNAAVKTSLKLVVD